jgi:hypothetical protein
MSPDPQTCSNTAAILNALTHANAQDAMRKILTAIAEHLLLERGWPPKEVADFIGHFGDQVASEMRAQANEPRH